ncbi:flagellar motor protein [Actinosynnema mirum]|uniref:MotA/TolQ/ExbB proton channel n=1 Tax=Actinosynnema mirum (strain ATCC 29888 / DSM 43827 / JCM 3225 / NBRC 14064 / NCIMB 13271 / NRRL B-12336 / IMRU 3971 / 101) TaxID=446462 RepID=C6WJQ2_ACTMD|nr:flagellar motor protein [Actinosynnema mirum]ACU36277.1 MotA/TolQ/ExbB proton channel [Actinosynnema mirum DSM 43827]
MDPASIAGTVLVFVAIFVSTFLEGGNPLSMFLLPPILLVVFGTIGAVMASGVMRDSMSLPALIKRAFLAPKMDGSVVVESIVSLADRARREGLLALEEEAKKVEDPFLRRGLVLAIDGMDSKEIREILEGEIETKQRYDKVGVKMFTDMGALAPTIGIIGTVLGLIHVLENLSDPAKLGHLIAGAFVATLWGVMTANAIWLPIGNRLKRISDLECEQMEVVVEGVLAIQAGSNPRLVGQKLRAMVATGPPEAEKKAA